MRERDNNFYMDFEDNGFDSGMLGGYDGGITSLLAAQEAQRQAEATRLAQEAEQARQAQIQAQLMAEQRAYEEQAYRQAQARQEELRAQNAARLAAEQEAARQAQAEQQAQLAQAEQQRQIAAQQETQRQAETTAPQAPVNDYIASLPQPETTVEDITRIFDGSSRESVDRSPTEDASARDATIESLIKQIQARSDTSRWTGGYGADQATKDMARILAETGITDLSQFGPITREVEQYVGSDDSGNPIYEKQTERTFGNKLTGQAVPNTYSERQTGNFFGGTFEGKGNTGYGVQFDSQGNPIFYTQGASSNDLVNLFQDNPLLGAAAQIAAATFGGPAGSAALAAAMGKSPEDILKSTALSYAGNLAGSAVSGMEGITDVLGKTGTQIAANAAKQYVGSGGNIDPVQALLSSGLNTGINTVATDLGMGDLTPAQQKMVSSGISGLIAGQTPEQIAMNIAMAAATAKPDSTLKSSLGPGDEQDFIDNLIPGYFQPGGAGYTEPAALPSPDEDFVPTMPAPEEMTVQPEPANIEEFIKSLEPYIAPAPSPEPEPTPEPTPAPVPEEMTVQPEPANIEEFIKSLEPYIAPAPSPEPEPTPEPTPAPVPEEIPELVMTGERPTPSPDEDFMPTYPEEKIPELVMTGDREKTQEHVFDPTFGGALPLDNLPYLPTDDDFVPTDEIEVPETPTTPVATPKVPTPTKAPTTRAPTTPAASSGMDMMGLLALLGGQQQPVQQAPMQDPYAHIKLMEDLFGSTIDLTPAGENTAQRK
jgi:hypothetical protein